MGSLSERLLAKARTKLITIEDVGKVLVRQPSALHSLELSRFAKSENVDFVQLLIDHRDLVSNLVINCVRDPEEPNVPALSADDVGQLSNEAFTPILQAIVELIQVPGADEAKS